MTGGEIGASIADAAPRGGEIEQQTKSIKATSFAGKKCFVIMPYGKKKLSDGSAGPEIDFDAVYSQIIAPAVADLGMICIRSDKVSRSEQLSVSKMPLIGCRGRCLASSSRNAVHSAESAA